jgi:hypothetical protein
LNQKSLLAQNTADFVEQPPIPPGGKCAQQHVRRKMNTQSPTLLYVADKNFDKLSAS